MVGRREEMHRYAEVLTKIGAALQKGQALCVEAPVEYSEFVEYSGLDVLTVR